MDGRNGSESEVYFLAKPADDGCAPRFEEALGSRFFSDPESAMKYLRVVKGTEKCEVFRATVFVLRRCAIGGP